jgi:hypothetical protein
MICMNRVKAEDSLFFVLVVLLLTLAATAQGQVPFRPAQANPASTNALALPKHAKLTTPLAQMAHVVAQTSGAFSAHAVPAVSADVLPEPSRSALKTGRMRVNAAGAVQVYIHVSSAGTANLNALKSAGVTVQLTDTKRGIVQAMVPADRLESVAALPFVGSMSLPQYGYTNTGSVTSQGDTVLKADKVRSQLGVTGKGVRVGVLADGIAGIFASGCTTCAGVTGGPISTGDIPDATGTRDGSGILGSTSGGIVSQSFRSSDHNLEAGLSAVGNEGTAMIEVVHDLAPDATFYFANFQTDIEFAAAMNWLAANTDVVVDDISFFDPPYDGTNAVSTNAAAALNADANPVRAVITSVGNEGLSHYVESYADSGTDSASVVGGTVPGYTGDFHLFQATTATKDVCGLGPSTRDPVFVRSGWDLNVTLTWDDPYVSTNDYDLWLLDGTGKVVAYSANLQNGGAGGQPPIEFFEYVNPGPDAFFYVAITNAKNAAAPKHLNVFIRGADPIAPNAGSLVPPATCPNASGEVHNFNTPGGSVPAMGDAGGTPVSVISVGAAPVTNPVVIEPYSSNGPTVDGRLKPDITGVDLVQVSGAGGFVNPFWGTSAAAPHIAGIAALLLQTSPCLASGSSGARLPGDARKLIYDSLTKNAFDLGAAGPDNIFGYGLADALNSASTLVPTASAGGDKVVGATSSSGAVVVLDGSGSTDPASCPLTYTWSGDCGSATGAKPSLTCPMGKSTATLTVSNNGGVTTSTATALITVTDFSVGATATSASVNSGTTASYTVTVTPQAEGFANAVALSCTTTAPKGICKVAPGSVTPGTSPANVTVTVDTPGTTGGNYSVTVTAASSTLSHTLSLALTVNDFAINTTSTTAAVAKGGTGTYNLTVGPGATGGSFPSAVAFTCTGAPSEATCAVSPANVTPGTTSTNVAVTVTTTAQKTAALHLPDRPGSRFPGLPIFAILGVVGIGIIGQRRSRRVTVTLVLLLLLLSILALAGCGGGSHQQTVVDPGTPSGTYTIVVTGTSGSLSHTTNLTLTVQ